MAFSLKKNTQSLFSLDRSEGDIASVHGIRFLNALMLIAAHKSMALFFNPYINRSEMSQVNIRKITRSDNLLRKQLNNLTLIFTQLLGQPWSVLGRAASLYTDPFIMLSGMLTSHSFLGRLNKTGHVNVMQEYISRLFR